MAYAGQIIEHPTLGITMKFIKTHLETGGLGWEAEYIVNPGMGKSPLPHTHLHSDEWFQVLKGKCKYKIGGIIRKAYAGEEIYLPANKSHIHPWNYGTESLVMRNVVLVNEAESARPEEIRKLEEYFEHWFHLACRGKVKKDGTPYLLQSAVFFRSVRKHIVASKMPLIFQDILFTPLALAGKLKGYRHTYYK